MFQTHIHRLRGIAILFIVALHCVTFFSWNTHPLYYKFLRELFDNSTVIFVFISGFLFQYLSANFHYSTYLTKKFKNVISPYLILAIPAIAYVILRGNITDRIDELHDKSIPFQIAWLYIYGGAHINYALWFIPIIAMYYLLAPALLVIDRRNIYFGILPLLILISVLGHRPTYTHGHNLQLALYFLSCYVLGMFFSRNRAVLMPCLRRYLLGIFGFYIGILCLHFLFVDYGGVYQVDDFFSFEHGFVDWLYLQKILLAVFLLGALPLINDIKIVALDYLADVSFTIYFVHLYILFIIREIMHWQIPDGTLPKLMLVYIATLLGCCAIAAIMRGVLGLRSRQIVGS